MPIFEYKCPLCDHSDEMIESYNEYYEHICPNCLTDCKHWFKLVNGSLVKSSGNYQVSYVKKQDLGITKGQRVPMKRVISAPIIHQTGYLSGDARFNRGKTN